ncbi:hypothetical protein GPA22_21210 [Aromatoleum toluvorans]|uniref:Uncharacterized protein n=1 Tax=Aromatoleum toluvorans TaxID=92002 RepID=A0ABX1Q3M4_9RHOO|nr:hypothetical protein [Aromatoleum toluvorans]NMG46243.1 hypothetical protein [Aromatoleum toluvorans]
MDYLIFLASKGDLPIELGESGARFIGKLLHRVSELNWSGTWGFWEWFWAIALALAFFLGIVAFLRQEDVD